ETEVAVEAHGAVVGGVDVEHAGGDPALGQAGQAAQHQGLAEAGAAGGGVDGDHVDLPETVGVDLRPAEPGELAVAFGQEEAGRVEPRLGLPLGQVGPGPPALFDVTLEGPVVDRQPGV